MSLKCHNNEVTLKVLTVLGFFQDTWVKLFASFICCLLKFTTFPLQTQNVYELVVEAYTMSVPELVDSILVGVSPIDSNDNPPQFTSQVYTVSVAENIPIGSSITQVTRDWLHIL